RLFIYGSSRSHFASPALAGEVPTRGASRAGGGGKWPPRSSSASRHGIFADGRFTKFRSRSAARVQRIEIFVLALRHQFLVGHLHIGEKTTGRDHRLVEARIGRPVELVECCKRTFTLHTAACDPLRPTIRDRTNETLVSGRTHLLDPTAGKRDP